MDAAVHQADACVPSERSHNAGYPLVLEKSHIFFASRPIPICAVHTYECLAVYAALVAGLRLLDGFGKHAWLIMRAEERRLRVVQCSVHPAERHHVM
jgi:hypothetical protein